MVETKNPAYWENLSKKGEIDGKISTEIENLTKSYTTANPDSIFNSNSFSFSNEFYQELDKKLNNIFGRYPKLPQKEIKVKTAKYIKQLYEYLFRFHIKKVECEISFDAFSLLKLVIALESIIDEAQFTITKKGIFIEIMYPSRICLIRIHLHDLPYTFFKEGKHCVNVKDLKNVLYFEAYDKSTNTLEFGTEKLFINIHSKKFDSTITRTLEYLDLEIQEIPLEMLRNIKYPFQFSLSQEKFIYSMKNMGKYSEVVEITADHTDENMTVIFDEIGQQGKGQVNWKRNALGTFHYNKEILERELKEINSEKIKGIIEKILNEQKCTSAHSLTFLAWLDKLVKVLEKGDMIDFSIRDDNPMRVTMQFE
ncbi:MAG: hypothetical protein ACFFG0_23825, partial [Candidatus Thorarchaeota archaeon]